jgi:ribosomal protein S18 acetylase RimI-like enzyme
MASASGSSPPLDPDATGPARPHSRVARPSIRPLATEDMPWAERFLAEALGGRMQARRGELIDALGEAGLVAVVDGRAVGLAAWRLEAGGQVAELTILAVEEDARGRGIGRALVDEAVAALRALGVERAWLVTTNDNLAALRLYQRAGWRMAALRPGAVDAARRSIKPGIPIVGDDGIPIRDEIELERRI